MFTFFKKKKAEDIKRTGKDSAISSDALLEGNLEGSKEEEVMTELSLHPSWNLPKEKEYVFRFLNNDLDPLQPNQISLAGVDLEQENGSIQVTAFLRNSLSKEIGLGTVELLLLDEDQTLIASKEFDLSELEKIPAKSSRPWMFIFENSTIQKEQIPAEGWSLAFNVTSMQPNRLELEDSWDQQLPAEDKEQLKALVSSLPKPKPKEVNLMGIQARFNENGDLSTTILIRNGNHKSLSIQQLPLQVFDAEQELVAQGAFSLNDLTVNANTSKPWTFVFPKEMVKKDKPDLSKWSVRPVQNS